MPEEINRIVVDEIADIHLTTDAFSHAQLISERKFLVGNTMIDCLVHFRSFIENCSLAKYGAFVQEPYVLMTMHRPGNVDNPERWKMIQRLIQDILPFYRIIFSTHPRTADTMRREGSFSGEPGSLLITGPLDYFEFQKLISGSLAVITDSGGLQEETAWYGIPCFTLRENTERPVTISHGTNYLLTEKALLHVDIVSLIEKGIGTSKQGSIPYWDGKASERIVEVLRNL
jgi:UDP-N-acetylglucosamine 2-epimerase (non-hydrolysing)